MDRFAPIGGPSFAVCEVEGCTTKFYRGGSYEWHLVKCVVHRMEEMRATPEFQKFAEELKQKFDGDAIKAVFGVLTVLS